jgi:hypothetical protein
MPPSPPLSKWLGMAQEAPAKPHKRDRRFWVRLSDDEHAALDKVADALGVANKSELVRLAIDSLAEARPVRPSTVHEHIPSSPPHRQLDRQWLYEINRIGNNLNQIARYCNIHGRSAYTEDIIYTLLAVDQDLKSLVREVRRP